MFQTFPLFVAVSVVPVLTFITTYAISLTVRDGTSVCLRGKATRVYERGLTSRTERNAGEGNKLMQYPYFFLSSSIQKKPASCVGTFGLSLTCFSVPLLAFIRHEHIKKAAVTYFSRTRRSANKDRDVLDSSSSGIPRIETPPVPGPTPTSVPNALKRLNSIALRVSVFTAIGGLGVCSFQSGVNEAEGMRTTHITQYFHMTFASIFFLGGIAYAILNWRIDRWIPTLGNRTERLSRAFFACLSIVQLLALVGIVPLLIKTDVVPNSPGIELMSIFEISLLATFMSTFVTFYRDSRTTSFSLLVWHSDRKYSVTENAWADLDGIETPSTDTGPYMPLS